MCSGMRQTGSGNTTNLLVYDKLLFVGMGPGMGKVHFRVLGARDLLSIHDVCIGALSWVTNKLFTNGMTGKHPGY